MSSARQILLALALLGAPNDAGAETTLPAAFHQSQPSPEPTRPVNLTPLPSSSFRGWDYLVQRLRADGIQEETLRSIYADPRMPFFGEVPFALKPRETKQMYSPHIRPERIDAGRKFLAEHAAEFDAAEKIFNVHRSVVAAILLVETHFGQNTGRELVINRLSRVAAIGEPNNVILNYRRLLKDDPSVNFAAVEARAKTLEKTFYPEVLALFEIIDRHGVAPFDLKGSRAGAFGLPQFLPSSFLRFGFDGDRDGAISLFETSDAIWSTANFLAQAGWDDHAPLEKRREAIWRYNHSDAYIDTVLSLARSLRRPPIPKKNREIQSPEPRSAGAPPPAASETVRRTGEEQLLPSAT